MKFYLKSIIFLPLYLYFRFKLGRANLSRIVNHWSKILHIDFNISEKGKNLKLLGDFSEFRSYLYYLCKTGRFNLVRILYPPMTNLFFPTHYNIGEGLVIQHGFSTIINCEKIGKNCQIWQNVTIGKARSGEDEKRPVIGDNVKISAGAIIIGNISIGNDCVIGAGAVVTKSFPQGSILVGNPARNISKY